MAETTSSSTYEEKPKVNWFLYVATAFFLILLLGIIDMPNTTAKWLWMGIAGLNVVANVVQITNTRKLRYVLWRRGLSIYMGNNREALIRFDKALVFKQFKGYAPARNEAREYGVTTPIRSFPSFGGRRRWLVVFEREDGDNQALVFDPTPQLEISFRQRLIEADEALEQAELDAAAPEEAADDSTADPEDDSSASAAAQSDETVDPADEGWDEEEGPDAGQDEEAPRRPQ